MKDAIDGALSRILSHQTWILGPEVGEFEGKFAEFIGARHAVGASSGTEALLLALRAISLTAYGNEYFTREDEVVTTAFSFTATGDTILRAGATPVFLDIDPESFCLDLDILERYLRDNSSKVKAIIPVHLYGRAIDGDRLRSITSHYKIAVVEDVAQACGSSWNGTQCGNIGDLGAFSFFPSKNLGGFGDAGMVTTNNEELAAAVRLLTKHGGKDKYNVEYIGYNARLDTIQAAVLLAKLPYLAEFNLNRRKIAARYNAAFSNHPLFKAPMTSGEHHVYHQYTVRAQNGSRENLKRQLELAGISTMVYYPTPLHAMKVFKDRSKVPYVCSEAEKAALEVFSLPIEPLLRDDEIERVISACNALQ